VHVVQVANFYGPRSGGLRTALHHLGAGYRAHGHAVTLIVPGARPAADLLPGGVRRLTLPAPVLPGTGGYRVLPPGRVTAALAGVAPDVVEVSDRLTLRGLGRWAGARGVASVMISHERSDRLLQDWGLPGPVARGLADRWNARLAHDFDVVVCTTAFARAEFDRIAVPVRRVPLGVDLEVFTPERADPELRRELAGGAEVLVVHCGRLSREKHVERAVDAVALLHATGLPVRLVVAGDGPQRRRLERRARGLPVTFLGFLSGRYEVARLLATADVAVAPGPHETFGLAALEALACGTPAVVSRSSALSELVDPSCGAAVADDPRALAVAVRALARGDRAALRRRARARAERFGWDGSVSAMVATMEHARCCAAGRSPSPYREDGPPGCGRAGDATPPGRRR
jgi:alpha-1,6-mannosyltransferase